MKKVLLAISASLLLLASCSVGGVESSSVLSINDSSVDSINQTTSENSKEDKSSEGNTSIDERYENLEITKIYELYAAAGGELNYDEWLATVKGEKGDKGDNGTSLLVGDGRPSASKGKNGDSYIDISSWSFYLKENGSWEFKASLPSSGSGSSSGILPTSDAQGLDYYITDDNTYYVAQGKSTLLSNITIPSTFNGRSVVGILKDGFRNSRIKKITIPDSIVEIEEYAFGNCYNLETIKLPNSVTTMGRGVFQQCTSLESVTLSNKLTRIPDSAFSNAKALNEIDFPSSVEEIGDGAFYDSGLTKIKLPKSIKIVEEGAFQYCQDLTNVDFGDGVEKIGRRVLESCKNITDVRVGNSVKYVGYDAFEGFTEYASKIDDSYYLGNEDNPYLILLRASNVSNFSINNKTRIIYCSVFRNYYSSLVIPTSVIQIGYEAINREYDYLPSDSFILYLGEKEQWDLIDIDESNRKDEILLVFSPTSKSATVVNDGSYHYLLTDDNLVFEFKCQKNIGSSFNFSTVLPNKTLKSLARNAFEQCKDLTLLTLPSTLTYIPTYCFNYARSLSSITIPKSITKIGVGAFRGCESLKTVNYSGTSADWDKIEIGENNNELLAAYKGEIVGKRTYVIGNVPSYYSTNSEVLYVWIWEENKEGSWKQVYEDNNKVAFDSDVELGGIILVAVTKGTSPDWNNLKYRAKQINCTYGVYTYEYKGEYL